MIIAKPDWPILGSFIYLDIWLVDGKYPDFSQIGQFVQSETKRLSQNYPIYFKFGQFAEINKNGSVGKLDFDAAI